MRDFDESHRNAPDFGGSAALYQQRFPLLRWMKPDPHLEVEHLGGGAQPRRKTFS
jgi:hypothetical protein